MRQWLKDLWEGFYTVLVEGDDIDDPVSDNVRGILDGHIVLSRELATQNHYPAIDVLESVSRLNRDLLDPASLASTAAAREHLALYRRNQDLINIGAYPAGTNPAASTQAMSAPRTVHRVAVGMIVSCRS